MKQPELFKQIVERYKKPLDYKYHTWNNIDDLRQKALDAINEYKKTKKQIEENKKQHEELLKYLKHLEKLEQE